MKNSLNILPALITLGAMAAAYRILKKRSTTPSLVNQNNTYSDMKTNTTLPRGYRNNNPLNIRLVKSNDWLGRATPNTDGVFEQFKTMPYGYRAALKLMRNYIASGYTTIGTIIGHWAPPSENDTTSYINDVCNIINRQFGENVTPFDYVAQNNKDLLCKMAYAMSIIENGNTAATRAAGLPSLDIIKQGYDLL